MTGFEQFLLILLPAVILAGGVGAALLHRLADRPRRGRHRPHRA